MSIKESTRFSASWRVYIGVPCMIVKTDPTPFGIEIFLCFDYLRYKDDILWRERLLIGCVDRFRTCRHNARNDSYIVSEEFTLILFIPMSCNNNFSFYPRNSVSNLKLLRYFTAKHSRALWWAPRLGHLGGALPLSNLKFQFTRPKMTWMVGYRSASSWSHVRD